MLEPFAWPGAALLFAIIFAFIFKNPLTRLIDRISKVGPTGVTATPTVQEAGKSIEKSIEPPTADHLKEFDNAVLVKYEGRVKADLDSRNILAAADRERILIRHYTSTVLSLAFERAYNPMYGSQLQALQFLNTCGTVGAEESVIFHNFFLQAKALFPSNYASYSFEQWM